MSKWQTMESAPKDGTKILVWTVHHEIEMSDYYDISADDYEDAGDGLYRQVKRHIARGWNSNMPVLWQPLPDPPEGDTP